MLIYLAYTIIALAIAGTIAGVIAVLRLEAKNATRQHCRVCGDPLHRPGGASAGFVGRGFCHGCAAAILRRA